ncbi:MAG TPA: DUF4149 domain-containing protein [Candidatus Angelobacter sp.]|nr:DUF4149 domain-containing protein [Candidatus Angelobacter sp.]
MTWLRAVMLLALIVWIGGIMFFAFVLAPTLFSVLPSPQMAGDVVSPTLSQLHSIGLVSGTVFLIASLLYDRLLYARFRLFTATNVLVVLMLALTAISQFAITPRMREVRSQLKMVQKAGYDPYMPGSVPKLMVVYSSQFNNLHAWSTRLEGSVLVLGLALVVVTARRWSETSH